MSTIQQIALALAVAGACPALAQDGAGAARRAAARMEEQAQASMLLLNQARQQYSGASTGGSGTFAIKSLTDTLPPKAPNMETRGAFWKTSIADASVAVSQEYIKVGRYDEASELLESALKTTPNHALAKRTLELLKDPIRTNPALTPQHAVDVEKVNGLLRLAFGYYELGQLTTKL